MCIPPKERPRNRISRIIFASLRHGNIIINIIHKHSMKNNLLEKLTVRQALERTNYTARIRRVSNERNRLLTAYVVFPDMYGERKNCQTVLVAAGQHSIKFIISNDNGFQIGKLRYHVLPVLGYLFTTSASQIIIYRKLNNQDLSVINFQTS